MWIVINLEITIDCSHNSLNFVGKKTKNTVGLKICIRLPISPARMFIGMRFTWIKCWTSFYQLKTTTHMYSTLRKYLIKRVPAYTLYYQLMRFIPQNLNLSRDAQAERHQNIRRRSSSTVRIWSTSHCLDPTFQGEQTLFVSIVITFAHFFHRVPSAPFRVHRNRQSSPLCRWSKLQREFVPALSLAATKKEDSWKAAHALTDPDLVRTQARAACSCMRGGGGVDYGANRERFRRDVGSCTLRGWRDSKWETVHGTIPCYPKASNLSSIFEFRLGYVCVYSMMSWQRVR